MSESAEYIYSMFKSFKTNPHKPFVTGDTMKKLIFAIHNRCN